jgi:hypothetical protein
LPGPAAGPVVAFSRADLPVQKLTKYGLLINRQSPKAHRFEVHSTDLLQLLTSDSGP